MPTSPISTQVEANKTVQGAPTLHWSRELGVTSIFDQVAVEAPLAIEVHYHKNGLPIRRLLGVTMRTPGHDEELALGLLRAEGLLSAMSEVLASFPGDQTVHGESMPTWCIELEHAPSGDFQGSSRALVTTSACGFCGRGELETLPLKSVPRETDGPRATCEMIAHLPEKLRPLQSAFSVTGGCHGAAICDAAGKVELVREDVGRHNAVDKLVGAALKSSLNLNHKILVLSGRASFELLQKASVAGLSIVVAVGAPSSAAVELANAAGITLIGFARANRLNIYTHVDRLDLGKI